MASNSNWLSLGSSTPPALVLPPPSYITNALPVMPGMTTVPGTSNNIPEQDLGQRVVTGTPPSVNTRKTPMNRGFLEASAPLSPDSPIGAHTSPGETAPLMMVDPTTPAAPYPMTQTYDSQRWAISPQGTLVSPGREYEWLEYDKKDVRQGPPVPWYRRRRWIACFVVTGILILLLVILLPIVFLVIIPKAVQGALDDAQLDFSSATITQAQPNSFHLDAVLAISNGGSTDASLTFTTPVIVTYNGNQVFNLTAPSVDLNAGNAQVLVSQTVHIFDLTTWEGFSKDLVNNPTVNLEFKASLSASAVGQTFSNLNLDKTVSLQGFGGLNNVSLNAFSIQAPTSTNGPIPITAALTIANPSNFNVQVGDILFNLSLPNGTQIGTVTTQNVNLLAGNNNVSAVGQITGNPPINSLQALFTNFVNGNGVSGVATDLTTRGTPQWLKDAIVGLKIKLNAPGDVANNSDLIQNISFGNNGLTMAFTAAAPYAPAFSVNGIVARLIPQFKFNVNFTSIDQMLTVSYQGTNMATINATKNAASGSGTSGQLTTSLSSTLQVIPGQEFLFKSFLNTVFNGAASSSVALGITGTANVYANTLAGTVAINGVPISTIWSLSGFGSLNDVSVTSAPTITSADTLGLHLSVPLSIDNPSTVTFSAGAITLNLLSGGQVIGSLTIPDSTVFKPGKNGVTSTALYNPQGPAAQTAGQAFLSSFISSNSATITAQGYSGSSSVASLAGVFSGLSFTQSLPSSSGGNFLSGETINIDSIFPPALSITLYANNDYAAPVTITHLTSTIANGGDTYATINQDMMWTIPANVQNNASPKLTLNPTTDGIFAYITTGGTVSATAKSTMIAKIGGYGPVTVSVTQSVSQ